jgi:hypothetical protein
MPARESPNPAPEARAERRHRAMEELLDVRLASGGPPGVVTLEVRNLKRQSRYTVYAPAFPDRTGAFCGCEDFARRDLGTCKHVEAAFLWLGDHPEAQTTARPDGDAAPLWSAIDQRALKGPPTHTPASRRLRYLGAPLLA